MSFSDVVKAELFEKQPSHACCKAAELAAVLLFASHRTSTGGLFVRSRNELWSDYLVSLSDGRLYHDGKKVLPVSKEAEESLLAELFETKPLFRKLPAPDLLKSSCCYRSFVKGAFIGGGTIADPEKSYRLEVFTGHRNLFDFWCEIMDEFGLDYRVTQRNGKYVSYFQNSDMISDFLSVIGAHRNMMKFENIKIEKTVRNATNRRSNCEEANLDKQSKAAAVQLAAVEKIHRVSGFEYLRPDLAEVARARLNDPGCSLTELGRQLDPPIGKTAVYSRMQKLMEIAENLSE